MKITNEQIRAIQEKEATRTKRSKELGDFDELLARQLGNDQQASSVAPESAAAQIKGTASLPFADGVEESALSVPAFSEEAADLVEGMFNTFERYADQIARNDGGNLREAYSLLSSMGDQIAGFKTRFPNAGAEQPELAAMLNELDVLTTTETFKFNRGDYL